MTNIISDILYCGYLKMWYLEVNRHNVIIYDCLQLQPVDSATTTRIKEKTTEGSKFLTCSSIVNMEWASESFTEPVYVGIVVCVTHTHTHTQTHTYIHTYIHTHTQTHTHTHTLTPSHTHTHTCPQTHMHTHTHTHIYIYIYIYTHTHTHTHTQRERERNLPVIGHYQLSIDDPPMSTKSR